MLAPNYRTAGELGITESQRFALIQVLGKMERCEYREIPAHEDVAAREFEPYDFSMRSWATCICGHATRYASFSNTARDQNGPFGMLFYRSSQTMEQAAASLRDFLVGAGQ